MTRYADGEAEAARFNDDFKAAQAVGRPVVITGIDRSAPVADALESQNTIMRETLGFDSGVKLKQGTNDVGFAPPGQPTGTSPAWAAQTGLVAAQLADDNDTTPTQALAWKLISSDMANTNAALSMYSTDKGKLAAFVDWVSWTRMLLEGTYVFALADHPALCADYVAYSEMMGGAKLLGPWAPAAAAAGAVAGAAAPQRGGGAASVVCRGCGETGHYQRDCRTNPPPPKPSRTPRQPASSAPYYQPYFGASPPFYPFYAPQQSQPQPIATPIMFICRRSECFEGGGRGLIRPPSPIPAQPQPLPAALLASRGGA
jgi:hypothetical protein